MYDELMSNLIEALCVLLTLGSFIMAFVKAIPQFYIAFGEKSLHLFLQEKSLRLWRLLDAWRGSVCPSSYS